MKREYVIHKNLKANFLFYFNLENIYIINYFAKLLKELLGYISSSFIWINTSHVFYVNYCYLKKKKKIHIPYIFMLDPSFFIF